MIRIDLNEMPPGATHYVPGSCEPWEKLEGDTWYAWDSNAETWWPLGRQAWNRSWNAGELSPHPIEELLK